ncbi:MAG: hypothetical protein J3K34DRAFT_120164 [Monoraphidium minutum]|nr:MAG: hypothetical protein J3K34DRAFT_120164 [Monoraphidium minutum]
MLLTTSSSSVITGRQPPSAAKPQRTAPRNHRGAGGPVSSAPGAGRARLAPCSGATAGWTPRAPRAAFMDLVLLPHGLLLPRIRAVDVSRTRYLHFRIQVSSDACIWRRDRPEHSMSPVVTRPWIEWRLSAAKQGAEGSCTSCRCGGALASVPLDDGPRGAPGHAPRAAVLCEHWCEHWCAPAAQCRCQRRQQAASGRPQGGCERAWTPTHAGAESAGASAHGHPLLRRLTPGAASPPRHGARIALVAGGVAATPAWCTRTHGPTHGAAAQGFESNGCGGACSRGRLRRASGRTQTRRPAGRVRGPLPVVAAAEARGAAHRRARASLRDAGTSAAAAGGVSWSGSGRRVMSGHIRPALRASQVGRV